MNCFINYLHKIKDDAIKKEIFEDFTKIAQIEFKFKEQNNIEIYKISEYAAVLNDLPQN